MTTQVLVAVTATLVAFVISMAEAAFVRMSRVRAAELSDESRPGARALMRVVGDPAAYLSVLSFVRVVAEGRSELVLGIQAVGQGVSELSAAFGLAVEMGATLQDIAGTIHAHPTLGEAFPEAAMKALGHALHI